MSEIAGQTGLHDAATAVVHESYSFACMRCGHGWEQSYEIEHHIDAEGHEFVMYVAGGQVVPSPLSRPSCQNCDGHVVRIMRAGQVSSVRDAERQHHVPHRREAEHDEVPAADSADGPEASAEPKDHHWHLSDLLHAFHRKAS
jgi:Zn finger protein HypA/HybF involved in hydrogenase expression